MSMKLTFLILSISFACASPPVNSKSSNEIEELTTTTISTIEEFGECIANHVRRASDAKQKKQYKDEFRAFYNKGISTGIATGIATGEMNMKSAMFSNNFHCIMDIFKSDLESAFFYFKKRDFKQKKNIIENPKIKPPNFFLALEKYYDSWMYKDIHPPEGFNLFENTPKSSTLVKYYQQWYYILTFKIDKQAPLPPFIVLLRIQLERYFKDHKTYYRDYITVLRMFAGQMSRSYSMVCELHHSRSGQILSAYGANHPNKEFSEVLFDLIPTWHFSEEQFEFLKILHSVLYSRKNMITNNGGSNLGGHTEFEKLPIKVESAVPGMQEEILKWTIIPYTDARKCSRQNIARYSMSTVPTLIQRRSPEYVTEVEELMTNFNDDAYIDEDDEKWGKFLTTVPT